MFAGSFVAGATTLDAECSKGRADCVKVASLALTPEGFGVISQVLPVFEVAKFFTGSLYLGIGSHCQNLVGSKL